VVLNTTTTIGIIVEDVFKEIGNSLGIFCEVDLSFKDNEHFEMEIILVGLGTSNVLAEELVIKKGIIKTNFG
jgi:hypothetical protein